MQGWAGQWAVAQGWLPPVFNGIIWSLIGTLVGLTHLPGSQLSKTSPVLVVPYT
jgi:hypothetical protein